MYASYTDSDTGSIVVQSSPDYGVTWSSTTVGTTAATNGDAGFAGWPEIAASAGKVVVAWIDANMGDGYATISTDYGATFSTPYKVAINPVFSLAVAAKGDRIAVASVSGSRTSVSVRKSGSWGRSGHVVGHDP